MIIVQRLLTYAAPENDAEVRISVYAPLRGKHDWSCAYEIAWPDVPRLGYGYGVDGTQALLLARNRFLFFAKGGPADIPDQSEPTPLLGQAHVGVVFAQ